MPEDCRTTRNSEQYHKSKLSISFTNRLSVIQISFYWALWYCDYNYSAKYYIYIYIYMCMYYISYMYIYMYIQYIIYIYSWLSINRIRKFVFFVLSSLWNTYTNWFLVHIYIYIYIYIYISEMKTLKFTT